MKLNRLDTHDRLLLFQQQQEGISNAVQECIRNVPDAVSFPFYIYGHGRTVAYDEKVAILQEGHQTAPDNRLIWMPVITKPIAAPNTYLFLCNKSTDLVEIIWMLPKMELWEQYKPGNMFFNESIWTSIQNYMHARDKLNSKDEHGPTDQHQLIWQRIYGTEAHKRKREKEMYELEKQPAKFEKI